ncbi:MAG: PAS domain S-box protein [Thermomicrobiales bacterium]
MRDEASIVKDEKRFTRFWQGIITDITERQLRNALGESEALFRSAFDDAATGIVLVGLEGKLNRINRAFAEMVGYSEDEKSGNGAIKEFTLRMTSSAMSPFS